MKKTAPQCHVVYNLYYDLKFQRDCMFQFWTILPRKVRYLRKNPDLRRKLALRSPHHDIRTYQPNEKISTVEFFYRDAAFLFIRFKIRTIWQQKLRTIWQNLGCPYRRKSQYHPKSTTSRKNIPCYDPYVTYDMLLIIPNYSVMVM